MTPADLRATVVERLGKRGHVQLTERIPGHGVTARWVRDYGDAGNSDERFAQRPTAEDCLREILEYEDLAHALLAAEREPGE